MRSPPATDRPLTVTELTASLNRVVEESFPSVRFVGEIGEISRPASGHLYFTVKDALSQLAAVMWRSSVVQLRFQPAVGMEVLCVGQPNVWGKSGRLQLIVRTMHEAGEGVLQRKFLELRRKLESEGLFDPARKRSLPTFPRSVGVVTSASGAAIHDIMVRARERMPSIPVTLFDVRVQGEGAAEEIAAAIRCCNDEHPVDVLIVGRGGGSLEDLWAFNEEIVVRAIFASRIPIVSAVGHETDTTLADLAADLRAPTPTAAAEMVFPSRIVLLEQLVELGRRLDDWERWLQPLHQELDTYEGALHAFGQREILRARAQITELEGRVRAVQPANVLRLFQQQLSQAGQTLDALVEGYVHRSRMELESLNLRSSRSGLAERLQLSTLQVNALHERLAVRGAERVRALRSNLGELQVALESLNPTRVLERGYSVVWKEGRAIRSAQELGERDTVRVQFAHDSVDAIIQK